MKRFSIILMSVIALISCKQTANKPATTRPADIAVVDKGNVKFESYFQDKTMRLDFFHNGTATEEHFSVDQVVNDGLWPGSKTLLMDRLELGPYFFEVIDKESKVLLYSRGFANVFGEWQSTPEAKENWGTFQESLRFPCICLLFPTRSLIVGSVICRLWINRVSVTTAL